MLNTFSKDLLKYLPSQLVPALAGFITAPIITRLIPPTEYGNYALAVGIAGFLLAFAVSGFGASVMRFFPAYKVKSELGIFFMTLNGSLGIGIAFVSALSIGALWLMKEHLSPEIYPLLFICILIFAVTSVFETYMIVARAQERSGTYSLFVLLVRYGALGVGLLLVIVFGFRVDGLLWGEVVVTALALPFLLSLTMKGVTGPPQHFPLRDAIRFWRYAWPLSLGNMAMWGLRISDRYIISLFWLTSDVGFYSVAYNLSSKSIDMLVSLFLLSMGPMVLNTWERQGADATEKALAMITRIFLVVVFPAAVGLSVLASPFIALLTGEGYHEGYRIVAYVAFSSFFWGLSQIASMGTLIRKQTHRIAINQLIAAAVNLGLNLVLIPRFGFVAAGFTTLLGYAVLFAMQAHGSRLYLTWHFPFKTLRNVIVASVCMGLAVFGVFNISDHGSKEVSIVFLFLSIFLAVPVYFIFLLLTGEINQGERYNLKRFLYKFRAGKLV